MNTLFSKIEFAVGMALLAVITGLVFVAAVMRFLGAPLIWSVDMAQLLFIWLCFLGACRAMRQRSHLGVDLVVRWLPYKARLWVETGVAAIVIAFLLALTWHGVNLTLLNVERIFGDSGLSYAFVTSAVPVGCVFLTISILWNAIAAWKSTPDDPLLIFARMAHAPETAQAEA